MKTTADWIEHSLTQLGITSYRLSKLLNTDTSVISAYKNNRAVLSEGHAIRLGELLGIDPLPIVASAAYERSKHDHIKSFWAKHAETIGAVAVVGFLTGTLITAPSPANAGDFPRDGQQMALSQETIM